MNLRILNAEPEAYSRKASRVLRSIGELDEIDVPPGRLSQVLPGYEVVLVRLAHRLDAETIRAGTRLKLIASPTTGLDHIDLGAAAACGVRVFSLKGETRFLRTVTATAEHTFGLLLALRRQIPSAYRSVLDGHWDRDRFRGKDLRGTTLGIVGYGRLGRLVAGYAGAFGMKMLACDVIRKKESSGVRLVPFEKVLRHADIVTAHIPFNSENVHLFDQRAFQLMKKDALFINTSRGGIVDETALVDALAEGELAGAAIDVLEHELAGEKARTRSPLIRYAANNDNLIITPHIGGATVDSMHRTELFLAKKIQKAFQKDFT